jgi:type II secretory pathway component HofQ
MMKIRILLNLILLTAFCAVSGFAQEKTEKKPPGEEQYQAFCKPDFVGEPISLNVVNADIKDILGYITAEQGFNFVPDDSIGRVVSSVNFDNVPWNVVLDEILEPKDLGIQYKGQVFRITTREKILAEGRCVVTDKPQKAAPVYTEFIKLKKLPTCPNKNKCGQILLALNHLKSSVVPRLSKRGLVEIDEASQTLIITDERENLDALKILVENLDNEEFYKEAEKGK